MVFYHNDLDGRCAAAVLARFVKSVPHYKYVAIDYTTSLKDFEDKIKEGEVLYFLDYSFSTRENIQYLKDLVTRKNCSPIWIDHHKTSLEICDEDPWMKSIPGIIHEGFSGAALTWYYFFKQGHIFITNPLEQQEHETDRVYRKRVYDTIGAPKAVRLVSDYDCWHYDYGYDTSRFVLGVSTYDYYHPRGTTWQSLLENDHDVDRLIDEGKVIKNYIDIENSKHLDQYGYEVNLTTPDGHSYSCIAINRRSNSWIFGDRLKDYDMGICWCYNGSKYVYSFFSEKSEINCSHIAKLYGGGGHAGAAGCCTDFDILCIRYFV